MSRARERGFVLAAMVVVLILAAAVTTGAFFAALQETRVGRSTQAAERALRATESAAAAVEAGWLPAWNLFAPGDSLTLVPAIPPSIGTGTASLTATGAGYFVLRVRGVDPTGSAARETATVIRLSLPPLAVPAVLTTEAALDPAVAAAVQAADTTPAGLACPGRTGTGPPSSAVGSWTGGWSDWDSLAASARAGGHGILLYDNDLIVIARVLTGIVLVGGDLTLSAGSVVAGVLLVKGTVRFEGAGSRVVGAVRAGSVAADAAALSGSPLVVYSGCWADHAVRLAGIAGRLAGRSEADLSGGW